ncbi:MAG: hypothetical protein WAN14_06985 [Candidatus Acidiferrales bacterium]
MPFINGKFYMNPSYGRAVEHVRLRGATPIKGAAQQAEAREDGDPDGHWVTIDGNHVLIQDAHGQRAGPQTRKHTKQSAKQRNPAVENKAARIIFNETSGLRASNGNADDLHDARVAVAHTLLNASGMSHPPSTVTDILTHAAARSILADAAAKAAWADSLAAAREAAIYPDGTEGAVHFLLDYPNASRPKWATDDRETAHYGPFVNEAGGGDVPRRAPVTIRTYTLQRRYW